MITGYSTLTFVYVSSHALVVAANQGTVLSTGEHTY